MEARDNMREKVKLPAGRVWQLPTELDRLWEGLEDIGVGPSHMGVIRKTEMHVELAGPKSDYTGFLHTEIMYDPEEVVDGRVTLIGPEANEIPRGMSLPGGFYFKVYGKDLRMDESEFLYRSIIVSLPGQEGFWAQGPPFSPWMRMSTKVIHKHSFIKVSQIARAYILTTIPMVERVEALVIVGVPEVGGGDLVKRFVKELKERQDIIDAKLAEIGDEDVDTFYGCTLCQTFAPNHVCTISPGDVAYCGIMSFNGAKVTAEIEPEGYCFPVPRGEILDRLAGHFSGVDEKIHEKSRGATKRVHLYSAIKYSATNCGCFEAVVFYIPDADGLGITHRRFFGNTPIGVPFSQIAGSISGGLQVHGTKGVSIRQMRTNKFVQGDGGWYRVVWMPEDLKQELVDAIPEEVYSAIVTEKETIEPFEIIRLIKERRHPIVKKFWKNGAPVPVQIPLPGEDWPED